MTRPKTKGGSNISWKDFVLLSEKIGPDLIKLGKELEPHDVEMNKLCQSQISNNIKAQMVMDLWLQRNDKWEMGKLGAALINIGRKQLADELGLTHLTTMEIDFIVQNIGTKWIQLARKLGLWEMLVDDIDLNCRSLMEKVYQVIETWQRINGNNATKKEMIDCHKKIFRLDIVDQLSNLTDSSTEASLTGPGVESYSHLNVCQPPRIDKDNSIDSIFIDQELEVFTLNSLAKPKILKLESLIQNIKQYKLLRTLVEGDPNFGKTTLASKIATDWAEKKEYISSHFDLVLLIPISEVRNEHLLNVIANMVNRVIECTTYTVENIENYFDQHTVLLILDGYIEMSPEEHRLIYPILNKNVLKNAYILITSRRRILTIKQNANNFSSSLMFNHKNLQFDFWDARVILKGVSPSERMKVFQEYFEIHTDTLDKKNELFKHNDELLRNPLLVVCFGWILQTYGHQDIRTATSIYTRLVNLSIHKTLAKETKIQEDNAFNIILISDEKTFSIQKQIVEFGELAMQKMIDNDILFHESDLKSVENSILLKSDLFFNSKFLVKQQEQTVYQPMHRSLLEFLVAFHVCYSSNDIHEFKQHISTLMENGLQPSKDSLLYAFIAGLLEGKANWLFESLSTWSHKYSVFKPEMINIFPELKGAENDLLQQMLSFVPEYCNIGSLQKSHKFSFSFIKRLLELAAEKQLISVIKWKIDCPFPISKISLDKLYVTTAFRNRGYFVLDNIHCKKLIYFISRKYNERNCSLKQMSLACRKIGAEEFELHLVALEFEECESLFDEIQKNMNVIKFQRVNSYFCQLSNKHVNVLTQLVESGCITKGITIYNNYRKIESDSLSKLWENVIKSSSITEFTLEDMFLNEMFEISMPFQLQLLHLGRNISIQLDSQVDSVTSIQNLTLFEVANNDNAMNALERFNQGNYFRCNDWLLDRCLSNNKVSFLAKVTELHLVLTEDFSLCPSYIQLMPSLTTFTLNVLDMRKNLTDSVEQCVISALENTTTNSSFSKIKQLKLLRIHFIPSFEVFEFFVSCFTKVESMNLECLELSLTNYVYFDHPDFDYTMYKLNDLLRNESITQLNLIDLCEHRSQTKTTDCVRSWFSEEQIQIKKRFYHNDQHLKLHIPWIYYGPVYHFLFYMELKKTSSGKLLKRTIKTP